MKLFRRRPGLFGYPIIKSVEGKDDIQGKILRFRGIWDDSEVLYGARNEYNIQYFLEDDEVEIRKRQAEKAGSSVKEPTLVLKIRLPRDFTVKDNDMPDKPLGRNEDKYYTEKDFILGNCIDFYGRDAFSRGVTKRLVVGRNMDSSSKFKHCQSITRYPCKISMPLKQHLTSSSLFLSAHPR